MRREFLTIILAAIGLACLAVLLAGCSAAPSIPTTVNVAVATPCDAPIPDQPVFPAEALTGKEDIFTIGKTLWADIQARRAYEMRLRTALEGCVGTGAGGRRP